MRLLKNVFIGIIAVCFILFLGLNWYFSNLILTPNSSIERTESRIEEQWGSTLEKMLAPLPSPTDFQIVGYEDVPITGKYFQQAGDSAQCAVIFAHGWTSTWAGMLKYATIFNECGCDLVLYNHRSHGTSGNAPPTAGIHEKEDLLRLTDWVQQEHGYGLHQIGWVGASWGAAAVLQAGAADKDVAFILADAPFQDWYTAIFERAIRDYGQPIEYLAGSVMTTVGFRAGVDTEQASPLNATKNIVEPVLLIHSQGDRQTNSQQSVNIAKNLNTQSEFHHLDWGGDHTADVRINKERYANLVYQFLDKKVNGFARCR
ncbi:MAG: alpha/beta hydrolase family protein [Saprospiraceae bacterium]